MEALPLCLNLLVPEVVAVVISVTAVLIFGEIGPQAICTGPSQIKIAAKIANITKFLMIAESIISFPLGKMLDLILGEHGKSRYNNNDLKALIELHSENAIKDIMEEHGSHENMGLSTSQTKLINGTIDLITLTAKDIMTPYSEAKCINENDIVNEDFIKEITNLGYSRYPVYKDNDKNIITGILLAKKLIGIPPNNEPFKNIKIPLKKPVIISPTMCLTELLSIFQCGKSHMALVTEQAEYFRRYLSLDNKNSVLGGPEELSSEMLKNSVIQGFVTLENVIEKAMGGEILDEFDYEKSPKTQINNSSIDDNNDKSSKTIAQPSPRRLFIESLLHCESHRLYQITSDQSKKKGFKDDKVAPLID